MKNIKYASILAALAMISCQQELQETAVTPTTGEQMTFTAVAAGQTRTVIENGTNVYWSPQDEISVFYGSKAYGKFTSTNTAPAATAEFTGSFDSVSGSVNIGVNQDKFWAVYPYSADNSCDGSSVTLSVPAAQTAVAGSFAPASFPSVAMSSGTNLAFWNVCGGVKFTVSRSDIQRVAFKGNNNEVLAGSFQVGMDSEGHPTVLSVIDSATEVSVTAPDGACFVPGVDYFMVLRPVALSQGFTMTFEGAAGSTEYLHDGSVEVKRSIFAVLEGKDVQVMSGANSFIVSMYGPCKFDARYKGNSQEPVGEIASAEVLWESFGTSTAPAVGDIVSNVSVQSGIVSFNAAGKDGNAVIAVKDAAGDILWSWHIWVCKGFNPDATAQEYYNNAGTVMDRNLGATSATKGDVKALGLFYQWGRKDPFIGSSSISSSTKAKSTLTWPSSVASDASTGTIDYVVKHPTTYVTRNTNNSDWYYTGDTSTDDTRWASDKGMYDPCPKGWRVPDGGKEGLWSRSLGSSSSIADGSFWDGTNKGMNFTGKFSTSAEVWYPAAGYLSLNSSALNNVGEIGRYWSCTPNGERIKYLFYNASLDRISPSDNDYRAQGFTVRCVKESAPAPAPVAKDLSANGTANCYIVSEYGPCKFDASKKGHTTEAVGAIASAEVLWESFGTSTAPAVGDIVSNVSVQSGIVSFTAAGKDGNAVIAVKDAAGDILWSWHIWVCKGFNPDATAQEYYNNAGTVMDRNLGATSATKGDVKALGLLYQWGRKDPFLGGESINSSTKAKSTISWPAIEYSDASIGTIDYAVKHPTTFVAENSNNSDWYYPNAGTDEDARWNSDKGMYDPCPSGWRVPDGGSEGLWAEALGSSSNINGGPWNSTNLGMGFADRLSAATEVWYPATSYLESGNGALNNVGGSGSLWSCTSRGSYSYDFYYNSNGNVFPASLSFRAYGRSVRCVKK